MKNKLIILMSLLLGASMLLYAVRAELAKAIFNAK
jgi:hypothetical protein